MKSVKLPIFTLVLVLMLIAPGCSLFVPPESQLTAEQQANLTVAARVFEMKGELTAWFKVGNAYTSQPPCSVSKITSCKDPEVAKTIRKASIKAKTALDTAESIVRAGKGGDPAASIAAARAALDTLSQTLLKVKGGNQ